jgi:HEAT repeats/von Willebrand factor type A domain
MWVIWDMIRGMKYLLLFTILLSLPAAAAPDRAFTNMKVSFDNAFGSGDARDCLAAVQAMATFGTEASSRCLVGVIPRLQKRINELLAEREAIRSGSTPTSGGRNPAPQLSLLKEDLDAEYRVLEQIETSLAALTNAKAILYMAKTVLLRDRFWKCRTIAAHVLGEIGDRAHLKSLSVALKDRDPRVRAGVLVSLGRIRAEEAVKDIVKSLTDKDWMVRSAAIEALAKIRDPETFEILLARMNKEDGLLAELCAEALEKITNQTFGLDAEIWKRWWAANGEKVRAGNRPEVKKPPKPKNPEDGRYYHEIPVKSKRTIFILDVSQSMSYSTQEYTAKPKPGEASRLDLAKRELGKVIKVYDKKGTFGLIAFHTVVKVWRPRIVRSNPQMKDDALEWIENLRATGTTNIYGALESAFQMAGMGMGDKYYAPAADTIFLLSDGAPTNQDLSDDDSERILRAVRKWNSLKRMKIHTIGLKGHSVDFMSRLAAENGGEYISRE